MGIIIMLLGGFSLAQDSVVVHDDFLIVYRFDGCNPYAL